MTSGVNGGDAHDATLVPPPRVRIAHRMIGDVHVFTAKGVDEFQVADRDLEAAFSAIADELTATVADIYGARPPYVLTLTYKEYREALYGVHRDPSAQSPLCAVIVQHAHMVDPRADFVPPSRLKREALQRAARGPCQPA